MDLGVRESEIGVQLRGALLKLKVAKGQKPDLRLTGQWEGKF